MPIQLLLDTLRSVESARYLARALYGRLPAVYPAVWANSDGITFAPTHAFKILVLEFAAARRLARATAAALAGRAALARVCGRFCHVIGRVLRLGA